MRRLLPFTILLLLITFAAPGISALQGQSAAPAGAAGVAADLVIERPARAWEFLPTVGRRAAFFGTESGEFESWAYPLKLFREFRLTFHTATASYPAASLPRSVRVTPEAAAIRYSADTFSVVQTLFVPIDQPGGVVILEVNAYEPIEITAEFVRDFQLMWPAAIGGTYLNWNAQSRVFEFGEEQRRFFGVFGSPSTTAHKLESLSNYGGAIKSSLRLGNISAGRSTHVLIFAGSSRTQDEATAVYQALATGWRTLHEQAARYYREYLQKTVSITVPDADLQRAYDWSRISVVQGLVENPGLGTGLIAGYRMSGTGARPGFAWFFGRDALWTSFALTAAGDFATARTALEFLATYQRKDGKVPHEISQSATYVPWFEDYPYGFASADATPLFIIAMRDYVAHSGDVEFARKYWDHVRRALAFLESTLDVSGFPQNAEVGHGWVEGGPLLPVKSELYQSGLRVAALDAFSELADLVGSDAAGATRAKVTGERERLNRAFWMEDAGIFAFALRAHDEQVKIPSVLATVPMWFDVLDAAKADRMINELAGPEHLADWGTRIISARHRFYNPSGYHFGTVWPLFTGWASVGQYSYHRPHPAYANLAANARLTLEGSAGHVTELLSGAFYSSHSTSSPHQIWSAAMVVSPILRGMFGLTVDAPARRIRFAPHLPVTWKSAGVQNLSLGNASIALEYARSDDEITLRVRSSGQVGNAALQFSPALSPRARVLSAKLNGRQVKFDITSTTADQHVTVEIPLAQTGNLILRLADDFGVHVPAARPSIGEASKGLRIKRETWSGRGSVTYGIAGIGGRTYALPIRGALHVKRAAGAQLARNAAGEAVLLVSVPATEESSANAYVEHEVSVEFKP